MTVYIEKGMQGIFVFFVTAQSYTVHSRNGGNCKPRVKTKARIGARVRVKASNSHLD